MELLIPPGLAIQILGAERRDQLPLVTLFTLLPIGALFLSASRGGIISLAAEMGFLAILIVARQREKKVLVAAALSITLAAILVSWLGIGAALDRFASYKGLEASEGRRVEMLTAACTSFRITVSWEPVWAPCRKSFHSTKRIMTASSSITAITITPKLLLKPARSAAFAGSFFWSSFFGCPGKFYVAGDPRNFAYHAGALVACLGLLVHAGVDFNFHIPSNALIFLLQAALATTVFPALPLPRRS